MNYYALIYLHNFIWSGIEEVITRTTRNRVDFFSAELRKSPWFLGNSRFRISRCLMISTLFLHFAADWFSGRLRPPNFIRSGIEEVITRTTRNRVDFFSAELRKSPWFLGNSRFRISRCLMISTLFLHFAADWFSGRLRPPNFIRSGIEEVITRTTRNRLTGETVRGFESHPLRQFKSRCKFAYDGIFPRFPVFQSK